MSKPDGRRKSRESRRTQIHGEVRALLLAGRVAKDKGGDHGLEGSEMSEVIQGEVGLTTS